MGKYTGYLLLSDMDGTLLSQEGTISYENREAIRKFVKEGGLFTIATGRTHHTVWDHIKDIEINCPAILFNGGSIYNFKTKEWLYSKNLYKEDIEDFVLEVLDQFPKVAVIIFERDTAVVIASNDILGHISQLEQDHFSHKPLSLVSDRPYKVVMIPLHEESKPFGQFLSSHPIIKNLEMVQSASNCFEVLPGGVSKGSALSWLGSYLGISQEKILAIGDYGNDTAMIEYAGIGAAPINAHPEVLAAADYIVAHHNHHAIADFLKKVFEDF